MLEPEREVREQRRANRILRTGSGHSERPSFSVLRTTVGLCVLRTTVVQRAPHDGRSACSARRSACACSARRSISVLRTTVGLCVLRTTVGLCVLRTTVGLCVLRTTVGLCVLRTTVGLRAARYGGQSCRAARNLVVES